MANDKDWITPDEAAVICGVTRACIHNWRKDGVFPTVRVERTPRGKQERYHFDRNEVKVVAASMVSVVRS